MNFHKDFPFEDEQSYDDFDEMWKSFKYIIISNGLSHVRMSLLVHSDLIKYDFIKTMKTSYS